MKTTPLYLTLIAIILVTPLALRSQRLTGTVLAADTGAPIPGATVRAVGVTSSPAQPPILYTARTDFNGNYTLTAPVAQYRLCVSGAGQYLDPCLWGGVATTAASAAPATLRLQRGTTFIVRVHASREVLASAETVPGTAVDAGVSGGPFARFPLPLIYESASARDYGAVLPLNLALTLVVTSSQLSLQDSTGAAPSAQGTPFMLTSADLVAPVSPFLLKPGAPIPAPATIVHLFAGR